MESSRVEQLRADYRGKIEPWYNPAVHVLLIYAIGTAATMFFVNQIQAPVRWYEWAVVPVVFVISNIIEWATNRYVMHRHGVR